MDGGVYLRFDLVRPEDFTWLLRKVPDWLGGTEIMIEIIELDGCVSFGYSVKEAKEGLKDALRLWICHHGESALPEVSSGAHIIVLESSMVEEDVKYINKELKKLN